jgi:hypothetical protein
MLLRNGSYTGSVKGQCAGVALTAIPCHLTLDDRRNAGNETYSSQSLIELEMEGENL